MCHFVAPEGGRASIEFLKTRTATQRSPRRIARMVAIVGWRTEHRHNRVADIFIDIAALAFDESVMAERYSFMNLTSSAGVIFSEIDEKPARSEKNTVTSRVSPPSSGSLLDDNILSITCGAR